MSFLENLCFGKKKGNPDNPGIGKKFVFHGSFKEKSDAVNKEKATPGAFILERGKRFVVVTERK